MRPIFHLKKRRVFDNHCGIVKEQFDKVKDDVFQTLKLTLVCAKAKATASFYELTKTQTHIQKETS